MKPGRRTNMLWGLVALLAAVLTLAYAWGALPGGSWDLIVRAAPALLILAGLSMLLRGRVPASGLISLLVTMAIVAGVAVTAFSGRASQQREDRQIAIAQPIDASVTRLVLDVNTLRTRVDVAPGAGRADGVTGIFRGSSASEILTEYQTASDGTATLVIREQGPLIPRLEELGRGTLELFLPPGLPLDVRFSGGEGDAALSLDGLDLQTFSADLASGALAVTLPTTAPEPGAEPTGTLTARDGSLTVIIPASVGARLELNRAGSGIDPQYDATRYNYLVGDVLESRAIDSAGTVIRYVLTAPRGQIRVETRP